jgi:hypothetical protein
MHLSSTKGCLNDLGIKEVFHDKLDLVVVVRGWLPYRSFDSFESFLGLGL